MNIYDLQNKKQQGTKISMVTCYDYTSARIVAETAVDCLLVGDSAAMTMHGYVDTVSATIEMMQWHTAAVKRGASKKFIISDLPFLSYRKNKNANMHAAQVLMQAGANALKLEGASGNLTLIEYLTESGIPIMGHIGLTPQLINILGGYKIQGKNHASALKLKHDAQQLQEAGCFAIVLECVPATLAQEITQALTIPTIGIGAGVHTDGQVLVWQDLLGLNLDFKPKFVKKFIHGQEIFHQALQTFIHEINTGTFPADEHCY